MPPGIPRRAAGYSIQRRIMNLNQLRTVGRRSAISSSNRPIRKPLRTKKISTPKTPIQSTQTGSVAR